ncbi:MAG: hypothetical protein C5B49_16165 [Bdellovibrio sp.]|nr:MAG: hypothetical protein C5B49_16165 [Bdellovibrio sp.]
MLVSFLKGGRRVIQQNIENSSGGEILEKIRNEFHAFRGTGTGRGKYPAELRGLVCAAVGLGIGQQIVANAGGVSLSAVNKWVRDGRRSKFKAKRLNLVANSAKAEAVDSRTGLAASPIRVRLISGVEIELPKSELNLELLTMLNSIGGGR